MLVLWRWVGVLLNYLSMVSFVKTVKAIPCSSNRMTWLLSL